MKSGRPRNAEIDLSLETAALALFAEGGLAAVNFDEVAKRAGVSRTALYRRWATREALVASALSTYRLQAEAGLEDWRARPLQEVLDIFVEQTVAALKNDFVRKLMRAFYSLSEQESELRRIYWSSIIEPRRRAFSSMIAEAQKRGEIDPSLDPDVMQDVLAGALSYRFLLNPEAFDGGDLAAYIHSVLRAAGFPVKQKEMLL